MAWPAWLVSVVVLRRFSAWFITCNLEYGGNRVFLRLPPYFSVRESRFQG